MRSLGDRLTIAFLVVGLTGAGLVALVVGWRTFREFDRFVLDRDQAQLVEQLAVYYEGRGSWDDLRAAPRDSRFGDRARARLILADAAGRVVVGPPSAAGRPLSPDEQERAAPVVVDEETVGYVLFLDRPRQPPPGVSPEAGFLARLRQALLLGAAGATLAALLLGRVLARAIARPVRDLTAATHAVAAGDLGRQVEVRSDDELGELAQAFNRMSAELATASRLRRQTTADIAHDLRTPTTV